MTIRIRRKLSNNLRSLIEYRIDRFHDLAQNKWFYRMNFVLHCMLTYDKKQKCVLSKYGSAFYY